MLTFNYRAKSFLQCVIAGLAFCAAGLPAFAQNAPATKNQATVTIEVLFEALNDGRWQEADAIAAKLDAIADDKSLLTTFVRATQMVASGDCKSGLPMAQNVLERSPLFLPAYDLVGRCLIEAGEPDQAAALFESVAKNLNDGPDKTQLLARAQSLRPDMSARYSMDFNAQPSSNLNRATEATSIGGWTINEGSRQKAGLSIGANVGVEKPVYISKRLLSAVSLRVGGSYDSVSEEFYPSVQGNLSVRYLLSPQTSFGVNLGYEHTFKGIENESAKPSLAFDVSHQMTATLSLGARAEVAYTDHQNDQLDGLSAQIQGSATKILSVFDRVSVQAALALEDRKAATKTYVNVSVDGEWEHLYANGFIGSLGAGASYRAYESNAPLTFDKQTNTQIFGAVGISHRDFMIGKFRPELSYRYTKQWSNDVFSTFDAHDVSLRAKAAF